MIPLPVELADWLGGPQATRRRCDGDSALTCSAGLLAETVRALPWYGGKARGRGQWIAGLLPWDYESLYCEPCCGMANVWAARSPVKVEILNDLNDRVINWWRVARDHADEFGQLRGSDAAFARGAPMGAGSP